MVSGKYTRYAKYFTLKLLLIVVYLHAVISSCLEFFIAFIHNFQRFQVLGNDQNIVYQNDLMTCRRVNDITIIRNDNKRRIQAGSCSVY